MSPSEKLTSLGETSVPPLIVAELSGNHMGDFSIARALVKAAADAGADAIKLQTYTADTMTLPHRSGDFVIQDSTSLWYGRSLHDLYAQAATPWEWHNELFDYARTLGLLAFSSPFDSTAVDFLDGLGVPCYKIASFELTDLPLIGYAASKNKPMILSTGMATLSEIEDAVAVARERGASKIILLKCTSRYPASAEHCNLSTMANMATTFGCAVGFSDHTQTIGSAVTAVALGACMVEKHLVLDRNSNAVDAGFSADPDQFKQLVAACKEAWLARGTVVYGGSPEDVRERHYRRSLYISKDMKAGDVLSPECLRIVRPGYGLLPKYYEKLIGTQVITDVSAGTALSWRHLMMRPDT